MQRRLVLLGNPPVILLRGGGGGEGVTQKDTWHLRSTDLGQTVVRDADGWSDQAFVARVFEKATTKIRPQREQGLRHELSVV